MPIRAWIASLTVFLQAVLFMAPATAAATPSPTKSVEQAPPWAGKAPAPKVTAQGTYSGHSGVDPYQAFSNLPSDNVFVTDEGAKLDQYLCRSQGPITFDLDITRVFGAIATLSGTETYNNLQNPFTMIDNGLIAPYATLYMRVYDVDHDYQGEDWAPEVDKVSINGHPLTRTLTSGNNRWDTVSFQVPIDTFLYPAMPALGNEPHAPNRIQVDIDTANTDEVWCVEVDWAALHIQAARPAVLVNGILSNDHAWDAFRPLLWGRGLPNYAQELDATSGIFHNASDLAAAMPEIKKTFGVDRINIVAHSKGGLDSRAYLRTHDDIDTLVQLATPNRGSDCAQAWLANLLGSTWDLDPDWIYRNFNYRDTRNWFWEPHNYVPNWTELGRAPIYIYAGAEYSSTSCPVGIGDDMDPPHDSVVSHDRATLPWNWSGTDGDGLDQGITDAIGNYNHSSIHDSPDVADTVVGWIAGQYSFSAAGAGGALTAPVAVRPAAQRPATAAVSDVRMVEQVGSKLAAGASVTHSFALDGSSLAQIAVIHGQSGTTVQLTGPEETPIPASLTAVPNGMRLATVFNLDLPAAGTYTVNVTAATDDFYTLEVRTRGGMHLTAQADAEFVTSGETIGLTATLQDASGNPVAGAHVTAELYQPGGTSQPVTLTEQGAGIYTASVAGTVGGLNVAAVRAVSNGQQRAAAALVAVVPGGASLGAPTEATPDTDGDGWHNALVLSVGAMVPQAGLYVLSGDLYDGHDQLIQRQAVAVQAAAGAATFPLSFDGATIYAHGADGPYTLRDVILTAVDQDNLPVASLGAPYTTQDYAGTQFQHAWLQLLGGTDQGQDADGDGLYNTLEVSLQLRADSAGWYGVSGRLVTSAGEELDWSSGTAYLDGEASVTLAFDGREIRAGGANGPYRLIDLMITGPQALVVPAAYTTTAYQVRSFQSIGPDLIAMPERITTNPAPAPPGADVTLSAVVENRGGDPTGSFPVAFYLGNPAHGGQLIDQVMVPGLAAESEETLSVTWTAPAAAGRCEIYVVLNADRNVQEFDYSNNTSFQVITVEDADTAPPVTTLDVQALPNEYGWFTSPVNVTLTAADDRSGVDTTEYDLDGSGWTAYAGAFAIAAEGVHTLLYRSTDTAGNIEATNTVEIRLDMVAPTITITGVAPDQVSLLAPVTPQVSTADTVDPNPTVTATLNGHPYVPGTPVTAYGTYDLTVAAIDAAGHRAQAQVAFTVADQAMYAAHLRLLVDNLAADVKAGYSEVTLKMLLAPLRAASNRLNQAEQDLRAGMRPTGHLNAAHNQLGAFINQLAALDLPEDLRQQWTARAETIRQGVTALNDTLR